MGYNDTFWTAVKPFAASSQQSGQLLPGHDQNCSAGRPFGARLAAILTREGAKPGKIPGNKLSKGS